LSPTPVELVPQPTAPPTDLLDVVVGEGAAILELLAGEDQALLVRGNALLVLDLGLDVVDGVRRLHLEGDSLARKGLHETESRIAVSHGSGPAT
jgi:hypothetical protein